MRVGWLTALLALLLLCSAGAQATTLNVNEEETQTSLTIHVEDPDMPATGPITEPASASAPPLAEPDPDRAKEETQKSVVIVQTRLQRELSQLMEQGELERLQEEVGHSIADAQERLPITHEERTEPEEDDPPMEPKASVTEAWPEVAPPVLVAAGAAAGLGLLFWFAGNSASVGAGAAGSAAAAHEGRRFLPYASPLFTRFEKDTVLGHPKREAIYGQIVEKPGVTLQDLCDETSLSRTAVSHHLRLLEQQHLIISKRVGRSRHFFENGGRYGRDQKDAYAVLHNDRSKDIHSFIEANPGAIQKDLCRALGIQASVAHWHVKRLREANLIEAVRQGRTVSYFPAQCLQRPAAFA